MEPKDPPNKSIFRIVELQTDLHTAYAQVESLKIQV